MTTKKCACGAITVTIDSIDYSMRPSVFRKTFGKAPPRRVKQRMCNHCVNNWGTDLCGCGSGEPFGKCDNGLPECRMPSQSIEGSRQCAKAGGAWL